MFRFNRDLWMVAAALTVAVPLLAQNQTGGAPEQTPPAGAAAPQGESQAAGTAATDDVDDPCRGWTTPPRGDATVPPDDAQPRRSERGCEIMIVTGTRLRDDPSLRIRVLTAAEIAARGLSSTEEILRAIPQNLPTINAFNNAVAPSNFLDVNLGTLGIGVATANLRGLGSRNTLVLVNGRRVAGVAGASDFFANLRNIPAAAIERVEVLLDSGGAVYGSDAVGGVVNIVLKQDYAGVNITGRYEHSATDSDQNRLDALVGYSWADGNFTAIASRSERDPVNNHKAGFTTRNYHSRFGDDGGYNFVGEGRPRSGLVSRSPWGPFLILPPGNDGRDYAPEDFVATTDADFVDIVQRDAGGAAEDVSATVSVNHTFFGKLTLRGEGVWKESETINQRAQTSFTTMRMPASNAFNKFGRDVFVRYDALREAEAGLIEPGVTTGVREHWRYLAGIEFAWSDTARVVLDHAYAVSDGSRRQYRFAPRSVIVTEIRSGRLAELLASSDPNLAPNFFGDGTAQTETIGEFYVPLLQDTDRSYSRMTTGYFHGGVFNAPGGRAHLVAGGEMRSEWYHDLDFSSEVELGIGLAKPTRDLNAAFVELHVPLIGGENARRGLQYLSVTAKARWDEYGTEGAVGNEPVDPDDASAGEKAIFRKVTFANVAPYFGIAYKPVANLMLRASHAEGFVVPRFNDMFSRTRRDLPFFAFDPLVGSYVPARFISESNPGLKPESSTTLTVGMEWTPRFADDLHVELYYADVDIRDRIAGNFELGQLLPAEVWGTLPQFFVRAEDGTLLTAITSSVNIARRVSQSADLRVVKVFPSTYGEFRAELAYNRVLAQFDQPFKGSERISLLGKSIGVNRYNASFNLGWSRGPTVVNAFVNHLPSYINNDHERQSTRDIPIMRVSSWTTLDLSVRHRFDSGVTVQAGGRDILGKDFPFMLTRTGRPHDSKRVNLRGRVLFFSLSYDFGVER